MAEVRLNALFALARGLGRRCIASLYFAYACGGSPSCVLFLSSNFETGRLNHILELVTEM